MSMINVNKAQIVMVDTSANIEKNDVSSYIIEEAISNEDKESYFEIRDKRYESHFELESYNKVRDNYDEDSTVFVAKEGVTIVGGCRVTDNRNANLLPFENYNKDFNIEKLFGTKVASEKCGELSRLALKNDVGLEAAKKLILHSYYDFQNRGVKYGFFIASRIQTRFNSRVLRAENIEFETITDQEIPFPDDYKNMQGQSVYLTILYM